MSINGNNIISIKNLISVTCPVYASATDLIFDETNTTYTQQVPN